MRDDSDDVCEEDYILAEHGGPISSNSSQDKMTPDQMTSPKTSEQSVPSNRVKSRHEPDICSEDDEKTAEVGDPDASPVEDERLKKITEERDSLMSNFNEGANQNPSACREDPDYYEEELDDFVIEDAVVGTMGLESEDDSTSSFDMDSSDDDSTPSFDMDSDVTPKKKKTKEKKRQFWRKQPWEQSLSEFVVSRMSHDPCGRAIAGGHYARCVKNGKCGAKFPKEIREDTDGYVDGYAA
jgi:hypothetical protein